MQVNVSCEAGHDTFAGQQVLDAVLSSSLYVNTIQLPFALFVPIIQLKD